MLLIVNSWHVCERLICWKSLKTDDCTLLYMCACCPLASKWDLVHFSMFVLNVYLILKLHVTSRCDMHVNTEEYGQSVYCAVS